MLIQYLLTLFFFFFQAEDGIRDLTVTGVQTCALPISLIRRAQSVHRSRSAGRSASIPSRSTPASAGASPLVETAIVTPDLRMTPPRYADAFGGSSTALTKMWRRSASRATSRLTAGVAAATTNHTSSRSADSKGRSSTRTPLDRKSVV